MDTFLARQPIFDRKQSVFAYELLFRSGMDNFFRHPDIDQASSKVIGDTAFLMGLEAITGGKRAFINVTRETLLKDFTSVLPKDLTVVEILESVDPDPEVLTVCEKLKRKGYMIALDDFVYTDRYERLLSWVDFVKVDFLGTDREERKEMVGRLAQRGVRLLAEKVESWEVFHEALELGYSYFQGYFFSKPVILSGKDIPGSKLHYLQLLREIQRSELDIDQLEGIIKREMSLAYKLLRYINSAFFGWRVEIGSIRHALVLLGEGDVKKWASLLILASMATDKPDELVRHAVVRAKFCESLASLVGRQDRAQDLFLMGLLSVIGAIVDRPMPEILAQLPIAHDVKASLLGQGGAFQSVYQLIVSYEQGDWARVSEIAARSHLSEEGLSACYHQALAWANEGSFGG